MQIRRFIAADIPSVGGTVLLSEGESQHALRVLRLAPGERLQLLDGKGTVADAELLPDPSGSRRPRFAECRVLARRQFPRPAPAFTLYVAPPRGKAFDLVLKAATELGLAAIRPILTQYGVAKREELSSGWEATLLAALKQSSNPWLPILLPPLKMTEALAAAAGCSGIFGASPNAEALALPPSASSDRLPQAPTEIWVGPEGGFSQEEERLLLHSGRTPVTLGSAILRVETAVPALTGFLHGVAAVNEAHEQR